MELKSILQHPARPDTDRLRDSDRKPLQVLKFTGVAEGQRVLDIYAGGGWYSELLSRSVGESGRVYAHNDSLTWRFGRKEMVERTLDNRLPNLIRFDQVEIKDIPLSPASLDIAFMAINYHDLFFTHRSRNGKYEVMREGIVDPIQAFLHIRDLLKPDGVLIVIDHAARPGSGYQAANDLHRIDPNIVKYQLDKVGFTLLEEAFYLRNPKDDLDALVFDEEIRGKTDRFIYKFGR
ncbi:hypothetical protein L2750_01505 [Shewanella submarina]|uniref:Class I SAM-dependent methyltransferase n=1 Tax=Shewanella submarina TaxID=2016376 RepID=A0ABV7GF71_9GAMM|nr:hypothetical protein [Shewanella submarina]MCL1035835.1 hypothetical protein [Shewanella submarina]